MDEKQSDQAQCDNVAIWRKRAESAEQQLAEARAQAQKLDIALMDATELAKAIQPLIPAYESVTGDEREKWQRVVDAIYKAADHADIGWRKELAEPRAGRDLEGPK